MKNYLNEITELENQISEIHNERYLLENSNNEKVKEVINNHFNIFREMEVTVRGTSAYFYLQNEEGYNKEIFSLYFDERYKEETQLRLSYYTTSTHSDFELNRVVKLGSVAKIILDRGEGILAEIFQVRKSDLEKSNELFSKELKLENQLRDYRKAAKAERRIQLELDLRSGEGVTLPKPQTISLKRSYSPKLDKIRIVEVSGKTCTVAIEMGGGSYKTTESRVNIENLIDQIAYYF